MWTAAGAKPIQRVMKSRLVRNRTVVALIAAYAVALQALLSAFLPLDPLALTASATVLCSHDGTDGQSHPGQHELPCAAVCAALGHGISGPLPPNVVAAYAEPVAIAAFVPFSDWTAPRIAIDGPPGQRGPPLA